MDKPIDRQETDGLNGGRTDGQTDRQRERDIKQKVNCNFGE